MSLLLLGSITMLSAAAQTTYRVTDAKSLQQAISKAIGRTGEKVVIQLQAGRYELDSTLIIPYSLAASLTITGSGQAASIIAGDKQVKLTWNPAGNGMFTAPYDAKGKNPDRLFLDGKPLTMARYPDLDTTERHYNGAAADAISDERVATWKNPNGAYIHALHEGEWGGFHYVVTGRDASGKLVYEGGWQNNRPAPMHNRYRMVENVYEELNTPGEWFYDAEKKLIFLIPPKGTNLNKAVFSVSRITDLIRIGGNAAMPVRNIVLQQLAFSNNNRSFMLTREPLLRSDWTIYRGGAILLEQTENITIRDCSFSGLGGNAVFLSGYNKQDTISGNLIEQIGASGILFVGRPEAVRSPAFRYGESVPWNVMDLTPGPKSNAYPQECVASDNLIRYIGQVEKQVAGITIDMAAFITADHNTIYHTPRAGINIGDGCWGGHLVSFNDVFETVLETGDHGAYNSWGRDRFWSPDRKITDSIVPAQKGIEYLDVQYPITLKNNRFQCDHGWDIDLDDGSSNYVIVDNICLNGGLKLREGYHRTVSNNIIINNSFHPHVWQKNSGDRFTHNLVTTPYAPIQMKDWGDVVDSNFFVQADGLRQARALDLDEHSTTGDPLFVDAASGNYTLQQLSPVFAIGFHQVDLNIGVQSPRLKKLAAAPVIRPLALQQKEQSAQQTEESHQKPESKKIQWLGATLKTVETMAERSAAGLHETRGVLVLVCPPGSVAANQGLQVGDVILEIANLAINDTAMMREALEKGKSANRLPFTIQRNQSTRKIDIAIR
ncbi:PDZ domain-containing protein [Flavihumibacter petaseus]|uniref:PDZ domain-containing protein n=1 Tax=Flavihumibacter petaseus TaxID=549295 RepID=UPI001470193C|nr:PDZ domain-containing protein [Flavihumibacter petaseus]